MALSFTALTGLPDPPTKTSPGNFAEKADAFLDALPDFGSEINTLVAELNKITSGLEQASPIAAWLVGTTYNFPDVVAGSDGASYRCIDTAVIGIDPTTDDGSSWYKLGGTSTPVGTVSAFIGGYFTDGKNGGFVNVLGNTVAAANAYLNPMGGYICDGSELNIAGSPVWNAPGRRLPNITDNRFIQGSLTGGGSGGSNTMSHVHGTSNFTLSNNYIPSHNHGSSAAASYGKAYVVGTASTSVDVAQDGSSTGYTGGGLAHNHGNTGGASVEENRPMFLEALYYIQVL